MDRETALGWAVTWAERANAPGEHHVDAIAAYARVSRAWSAIAALLPPASRPAPEAEVRP